MTLLPAHVAAILAVLLPLLPVMARADGVRVRVSAYPRFAMAPVEVSLTGRVLDPGQELQCHSFVWGWGLGEGGGSWTPHCDPYQAPDDRPRLWAGGPLSPKAHTYRRPGKYEITLRVTSGDRTLQASVSVTVAGRGLLGAVRVR